MRYSFSKLLLILALSAAAFSAYATNLLDVYQDAASSDPVYKNAYATYLATCENLPISQSALLPSIGAEASLNRNYNSIEGTKNGIPTAGKENFYNNQVSYGLSLTQKLFNLNSWAQVASASAEAKSAQATYSFAEQSLMLRVASAYFNILKAQDVLHFTKSELQAVRKQLTQSRAQYKVGLIPITNYYEAKARYDAVHAEEIAAQNDLSDQWENLRAITNVKYAALDVVGQNLPLVSPNPKNINRWVEVAKQQNYNLAAARFAELAAKRNVLAQGANHLPTVDLNGSYGYSYNDNPYGVGGGDYARNKQATLGLNFKLPVFQGGAITAQTRQARYQYDQATSSFEAAYRGVINQTRQSYLGVESLIGKVKADRQAIVSQRSALKTTLAAYKVGMRTMVDVLVAESNLYKAEKAQAQDQYDYLLQTLTLKQAAGTLSVADLGVINSWLQAPANFKVYAIPNKVKNRSRRLVRSKRMMPKRPSVKKLVVRKAASKVIKSDLVSDSDYVINANPQRYTVKMYVANSQASATDFVVRNQLKATHIFQVPATGPHKKVRYFVLHGDYGSLKNVQNARDYWQNALPGRDMVITRFATLQKLIH